jgi:membrane-bound inhibitor of C-type lysozyme
MSIRLWSKELEHKSAIQFLSGARYTGEVYTYVGKGKTIRRYDLEAKNT